MAELVEPAADENPFLTSNAHAPATALSEKLGLSPVSHHDLQVDQDEENSSEGSEGYKQPWESEHEVDASVLADMAKLEDTFDEIGLKFRMIDRIGEGMVLSASL